MIKKSPQPKVSTTQKSLDYLRRQGMVPAVVEYWLSFPERKNGIPTGKTIRVKRDLWNMGDILCFDPRTASVVIVQTTTTAHQADRLAKIQFNPIARQWLSCPSRRIEVHGWMKSLKSNRWEVTITNVREENCVADLSGLPLLEGTQEDDF